MRDWVVAGGEDYHVRGFVSKCVRDGPSVHSDVQREAAQGRGRYVLRVFVAAVAEIGKVG